MKTKFFLAVLLTALFLAPFFHGSAEEPAPFVLDEGRVLPGMSRSWLQGYEPSIEGNRLTLVLPILSEKAMDAVRVELLVQDESVSPFRPQSMAVTARRNREGVYAARLTLALHADRRNGDYGCTLRITGETASGETLRTDIPYTLRIRDGLSGAEMPRVRICGVLSNLKAGEDSRISLTLVNPCRTVTLERPVLRIRDESGEILPQDADVLYLDDLAPGESRTVSFPVAVKPNAAVSRHVVQITVDWVSLGQAFTQTEGHTVPVTQEMRLEQGGVRMPGVVVAGDSLTIALPLMNMGRADLVNVLATAVLPGVTDGQSVLVGTIAPGETKQAQLTLTPGRDAVGDCSGTLSVEAEDHDGNTASLFLPINLTVEPPAVMDDTETSLRQEDEDFWLIYGLGGGCVLLMMLCVIQGTVLRRKARRMEEDRL